MIIYRLRWKRFSDILYGCWRRHRSLRKFPKMLGKKGIRKSKGQQVILRQNRIRIACIMYTDNIIDGQSPEHLYLFFACNNKKKLNFAGIYDKRKKYIVMELP